MMYQRCAGIDVHLRLLVVCLIIVEAGHATQEQVTAALTAEVREHHRFLLRELLALVDEHLSSWAGVCPGHKVSAGKRLSGRVKQGNRYVRAALVRAAHGVRRSNTYLGERYRRLKKRRGSKRAALAVGHNILVIYYQMMKTGQEYHEKGEEFFQRGDRGKLERQLVQRLERMGYAVVLQPKPAA